MMNETAFTIRRANAADADALAPLAVTIFNDAFADNPLNKPEDMRAYVGEAFSLEQTRRELSDDRTTFFVAETGDRLIGYAKLQEGTTEACVSDARPIELSRLYVLKDFHGRGVAERLMDECFALARRKNYRTMWLGVWEHNRRAQRFYEKLGFRLVGEHVFQLGSDPQIDWVMEKTI